MVGRRGGTAAGDERHRVIRRWCAVAGMMMLVQVALFSPCKTCAEWYPAGIEIMEEIFPTRCTVGDRLRGTIAVSAPRHVTIMPPALKPEEGIFSVRELGRETDEDESGERRETAYFYELSFFQTGTHTISPVDVVVKDESGEEARVSGGAIAVHVESVLPENAEELREIKAPLTLGYIPVWMIASGIIAIVVGIVFLIFFLGKRGSREERRSPPAPAHVIALEELRQLQMSGLIEKGRVEEYYVRLSLIVRRYIERRFGLKAPDRTTEEFLAEAHMTGFIDERARELIGRFLEQCDWVKFARYGPTHEEADAVYRIALQFVEETKRVETSTSPVPMSEAEEGKITK